LYSPKELRSLVVFDVEASDSVVHGPLGIVQYDDTCLIVDPM
jgi:hypothetical protein